ncbi:MAG: hypothetical protein ABR609_10175 [Acidimicrobiia bacterium]
MEAVAEVEAVVCKEALPPGGVAAMSIRKTPIRAEATTRPGLVATRLVHSVDEKDGDNIGAVIPEEQFPR